MPVNQNQFQQAPIKGQLDLTRNNNVMTMQIDPASAEAELIPGEAVKLVDVDGSVPVVDKAGNSDVVFGYVVYTTKQNTREPGDVIEVAFFGSVQWLEAASAIARGAEVELISASNKVQTAATSTVVGFAIDKATGDLDLVRILLQTPLLS